MVMKSVQVSPDHGNGKSKKARRDHRMRVELFAAQKGKCHWCGDPMEMEHFRITDRTGRRKHNPAFATFEHLRPRSMGGRLIPGNVVLAHQSCNGNRHKRKFAHDPIYGDGSVPLPPFVPPPYQGKPRLQGEPRNRIKAKPIAETRRVLRGGYWMEK